MTDRIKLEYYTEVARRLKKVMVEKSLTEGDVVRLCKENGFQISQAAVSKTTSVDRSSNNYSITLINFVQICKALQIPVESILDHSRDDAGLFDAIKVPENGPSRRAPLVYNTDEDEFNGYLGEYITYFYPTISSEEGLLRGELAFQRSAAGNYCCAHYELDTGKRDGNGQPIIKTYEGELIISIRMNACYCCLYNKAIGEICFLAFHHMYLNNEELCCRLATAVTVSAGDNRRPTLHRILLVRKDRGDLSEEELSVIKPQLLLNSSDILISTRCYDALCREGRLPEEMRDAECFIHILPKEEYYSISEAHIRALHISREEKAKALCALRSRSAAPKYNKIGSKCDELIFEYLYGGQKRAHPAAPPKEAPLS